MSCVLVLLYDFVFFFLREFQSQGLNLQLIFLSQHQERYWNF